MRLRRVWVPIGVLLAVGMLASAALAQDGAAPVASGDGAELPESLPEVAVPSRRAGATTAKIIAPVNALKQPGTGRRVWRVPVTTNWSHQRLTLMVLGSRALDGALWLKLRLPLRQRKRRVGWVPADAAKLAHSPYWIDVVTKKYRVKVFRNGRKLRSFRAVVGSPATPTPHGLEAIYERNRQPDPNGFVGSWVLALTANSRVLRRFDGGQPRIGIHGRGGASFNDPLGSARSHGCIRINNSKINWLSRAPAGTPVRLR